MYFKQFYLGCLAHASYLIGSEGEGAVVDPQRDVDQYLDEAAAQGIEIKYIVETHLHADFVSGHRELAERTGAEIVFGRQARATFPHRAVKDGDEIKIGRAVLRFLETPGHTPESISILVIDTEVSDQPQKVLTGDTLFIGDVGRPDLRGSLGWPAETLGRMLYRSLHDKLLALPDDTLVYPAHGAGSLCGKAISKETVSTLGDQRRSNYALQPMSEEAFVALVTADQPDAPAYFTYDAVLNARERPSLDSVLELELKPLLLARLLELSAAGAQILDVREPAEFAQGHLRGSVNIGLGGQYATWAGTLLSHDQPIVIVASPGREQEAATRLGRIGFDNVAGYLAGGMQSVETRPDLMSYTRQIDAGSLATRLADAHPPVVLDVRTPHEWEVDHIEGAKNVPLSRLPASLNDLPRDRDLVVHCAGGYRSSIAISLLQQSGFTALTELAGGISAWNLASA